SARCDEARTRTGSQLFERKPADATAPDSSCPVSTSGGDELAVGTPSRPHDGASVTGQGTEASAARDVPNPRGSVCTSRDEKRAVGVESGAVDEAGMAGQ